MISESDALILVKFEQISSVRDIAKSTIEGFSHSSSSKRLLRLGLTDGHTEITAIEFSHIPSILDDVVPGTKVISQFYSLLKLLNFIGTEFLSFIANCVHLAIC